MQLRRENGLRKGLMGRPDARDAEIAGRALEAKERGE